MRPELTKQYKDSQISELFNIRLQNDGVQDFDVRWGPNSIISKRNSHGNDPGMIVQVKNAGFCSASDCLGSVRPRNCPKTMDKRVIQD